MNTKLYYKEAMELIKKGKVLYHNSYPKHMVLLQVCGKVVVLNTKTGCMNPWEPREVEMTYVTYGVV